MRYSLRTGMIMLNSFVSVLALVGCQTIAWFGGTAEYTEEIEQNLSFEGVELVKLRNVNGGVAVTTWEEPEVLVKATKRVKATSEEKAGEYSEEVKIRIEKVGAAIEIITEYPKGRKPSYIKSASVAYDITMPKEANLDVSSTNGGITIEGIVGETSAKTTNGPVNITACEGEVIVKTTNGRVNIERVSGRVEAKTSNGGISANLTMLDERGKFETTNGSVEIRIEEAHSVPIEANTTNGSITIELPSDFTANLEAKTTNGRIRSDLPITVAGKISKTSLHGELNGGGALMKLKTTNGNINIKANSP